MLLLRAYFGRKRGIPSCAQTATVLNATQGSRDIPAKPSAPSRSSEQRVY